MLICNLELPSASLQNNAQWILVRTSSYIWEQSLTSQLQVAKILLLSLIIQHCSPHTACNTSQCQKSTLHSQEKVLLVRCHFKSFSERNIHLFKYIYRCIKSVWKETLLEEMLAIQVRPPSWRKAAGDLALSSVPFTIYTQAGKLLERILPRVSEAEKRKKSRDDGVLLAMQ